MSDLIEQGAASLSMAEVLTALLAGDRVLSGPNATWRLAEGEHLVSKALVRELRRGWRLVPAGDALPGLPADASQTWAWEPLLSRMDVSNHLTRAINAAGGTSALARKTGVSVSMLSDVDCGRITDRGIPPSVLGALGLRRLEFYGKAGQ